MSDQDQQRQRDLKQLALRDQYACAALTGLLAGGGIRVNQSPYIGTNNEAYDLMKSAFEIADEALRQRDKPND